MHMADALTSPAIGGAMWAVSSGLIAHSARKLKAELDERKVPLMGVLGAFIFSAQMINFSIPGTGSSGHLGGGMILAILLGPYAAFLTIASVVTVQALFFADGGLLALGCNIFNLGFFPCFIAYPLIFKKIAGHNTSQGRLVAASTISAIVGLQLGSFSVVLETMFSHMSELPFSMFVMLMQPVHLAIGIIEGLITASVAGYIWKARPEILEMTAIPAPLRTRSNKKILVGLSVLTIFTAGLLSWFASTNPDGLEWALLRTSGKEKLQVPENNVRAAVESFQQKTAVMPEYEFKKNQDQMAPEGNTPEKRDSVKAGTSIAGLVGAALTLSAVGIIGFSLKKRREPN